MKKSKIISAICAAALLFTMVNAAKADETQKIVNVSNTNELINAVKSAAPNTKIVIASGKYIVSDSLMLQNLDSIELEGSYGCEIASSNGEVPVVEISESKNIVLNGLTLGHTVPEYGCGIDGIVVNAVKSENITIKNSDLYGCGTSGIDAYEVSGINVENTTIRECMISISNMMSSENATFTDCTFYANAYDKEFQDGCAFSGSGKAFEENEKKIDITFNNCIFKDNLNKQFANSGIEYTLNNCTMNNNAWETSYLYDEYEDLIELPTIAEINDVESALNAVKNIASSMTDSQKKAATNSDLISLFAEEAVSKALTIDAGDDIHLNDGMVSEQIDKMNEYYKNVENIFEQNGITKIRKPRKIITVTASAYTDTVIHNSAMNNVDGVKIVKGPATVYMDADDETVVSVGQTHGSKIGENKVKLSFETDKTSTVKLSFEKLNNNSNYVAVVDEEGKPVGGKYNPASDMIEAKVSKSGIYSIAWSYKDFFDIYNKSNEMQAAIETLAAKGIINGTSEHYFTPNDPISRAEVAALILRTLSKLDPNENGGFSDVNSNNWYFGTAGSSKKYGIITGFPDNTFKGDDVIKKDQIIAVAARTLRKEMNYYLPSETSEYLNYSDKQDIAQWAIDDVALGSMANLVVRRMDGKFDGDGSMTRGDAAIVLYRLFMKLW